MSHSEARLLQFVEFCMGLDNVLGEGTMVRAGAIAERARDAWRDAEKLRVDNNPDPEGKS